MPADDPVEGSIPVDRWPWPLCVVETAAEPPIVRGVTDRFEDRFGTVVDGTALPEALDAAGFEKIEWASDATELWSGASRRVERIAGTSGESNEATDGATSYVFQVLPHPDPEHQFLSFTPLSEVASERSGGDAERAGVEAGSPRSGAAPARIDVEDVASVLSHDLRNPLDVAKARLRAGRETGDDEHFEHVARAHDRMERLLEDALTLARTDAVNPDEEVALESVAERAWSTVETADARLEIAVDDASIVADEDRLRRLFENCFRNSIEHGATDDQAITVTVGQFEDDGQRGFYVGDDGHGLPDDGRGPNNGGGPDDGRGLPASGRDRVFEPGFSADETSTGLGLAIVERIAARHGWTVAATENADGGARFEFRGVQLRTED